MPQIVLSDDTYQRLEKVAVANGTSVSEMGDTILRARTMCRLDKEDTSPLLNNAPIVELSHILHDAPDEMFALFGAAEIVTVAHVITICSNYLQHAAQEYRNPVTLQRIAVGNADMASVKQLAKVTLFWTVSLGKLTAFMEANPAVTHVWIDTEAWNDVRKGERV